MVTKSKLIRTLTHLWFPDWRLRRRLPRSALRAIQTSIRSSERRHRGEIRFAVEASLPLGLLRRGQTAAGRALDLFSVLRVWDTEENNGVLMYLLLADRDVEIVADRGIHRLVGAERWEAICLQMEAAFRQGRFEAGCLRGVEAIGAELERHFPGHDASGNELPDRPAVL